MSLSPTSHRVQIQDDLGSTATTIEEPRQANSIQAILCGASGRGATEVLGVKEGSGRDKYQMGRRWCWDQGAPVKMVIKGALGIKEGGGVVGNQGRRRRETGRGGGWPRARKP